MRERGRKRHVDGGIHADSGSIPRRRGLHAGEGGNSILRGWERWRTAARRDDHVKYPPSRVDRSG
jgi:hypothetical protein